MKKITMEINGAKGGGNAKEISSALNGLSGVVAADVTAGGNEAYAYAGDKLDASAAVNAVRKAGYGCNTVKEEYLSDVDKKALETPYTPQRKYSNSTFHL